MRVQRTQLIFLFLALAPLVAPSQQPSLDVPPSQLVREVVFNEMHDHQLHGFWRYWIERHSSAGKTLEQQVETSAGPITLLAPVDGQPLTEQARRQELERLDLLLASPQEQARHLRQYRQDENRIATIVSLLPDAFLFDFDGMDDGCYRLHFHPNPAYTTRTIEGRILHSMSGTLWIDARYRHLARLDGRIDHDIDFGFGILGRVYKGGWFQLQRVRVGPNDWKTEHLEVHMNIRALLVTNIARETSEMRGGFTAVPATLSLSEGAALLEQTPGPQPVPSSAIASAVFTPNR